MRQKLYFYGEILGMSNLDNWREAVERMEDMELRTTFRGLEVAALAAAGSEQQKLIKAERERFGISVGGNFESDTEMSSPGKRSTTLSGVRSGRASESLRGHKESLRALLSVRRMSREELSVLELGNNCDSPLKTKAVSTISAVTDTNRNTTSSAEEDEKEGLSSQPKIAADHGQSGAEV